MSSFNENAAAAQVQGSPAQNTVNFALGSATDGASGVHAPPPPVQTPPPSEIVQVPAPVNQPESVVAPAPAPAIAPAMTAAEVVKQFAAADVQSNGNGGGEGSNGSAAKRKRGRPRKYVPGSDGSYVAASPVSAIAPQSEPAGGSVGGGSEVALGGSRKRRGRPAGSRGKLRASGDLPFSVAPTVSGPFILS